MKNPLTRWRGSQLSPFTNDFWSDWDRQMNSMFESFKPLTTDTAWGKELTGFGPSSDVQESDESYLVSMDIPGMKADEIQVEFKDGQLDVRGERKSEVTDEDTHKVRERFVGKFQRSVYLPKTEASTKIDASYTDGVLKIMIPKAEKAESVRVKVNGG